MFLRPLLSDALRLAREGRAAEAKALLTAAGRQFQAPEIDHCWARVLALGGESGAAIEHYRAYLRRVPADFRARGHAAALLAQTGKATAAQRELKEAVARAPSADRPLIFTDFGNALVDTPRLADAIDAYMRAVELRPDHAQIRLNLASALSLAGHKLPAIYHMAVALRLDPTLIETTDPDYLQNHLLALLGLAEEPERQRRHAIRLAGLRTHGAAPLPPPPPRHRAQADSRIRVGYVSPDFRHHAVAAFFAPVLEAHDRQCVSIYLYGEVAAPDAVTERLEAAAESWRSTCGVPARALAEQIRADGIDVLVDLAGWTGGSRLDAFAHRPAANQLTWLGYAATTGFDAATGLDGRITDAWADPPGESDTHFTERLWRLPSGFTAYRPLNEAPAVATAPAADRGHITFGSFNNAAKISDATVALWARTVAAVPGATLLLKSHANTDRLITSELRGRFAAAGLAGERLELRPPTAAHGDHLRVYNEIDIALDTFPYNGTTTTCEALWMGVPVVSLVGHTHASRVGLSLLARLGLAEFATRSPDEFVATATALVHDDERLAALRSTLRSTMVDAALFSPAAIARDLETLYRQLCYSHS